jgi:hypothetical protein
VFDQVLNSGSHKIPAGEPVGEKPALVDMAVVSDAGATVRKLVEAEAGSAKTSSHEWFVAIDEKQVGPLSMEKVKDYWDRGEVGPDSLCWRAGFSDWIPLSEASELASVLAPRPTKAVIVAPAPVEAPAPVASGPVESAFSAGGFSKSAKSESSVASGPSATQEASGWKPSAASVLASLVKEENEALSKPAPKAAAPVEEKPKPASSGLLDLPPPEAAPVAAPSPMRAEAPAPYLAPQPVPQAYAPPHAQHPQPYAQPMPQAYAPPPGYGYPPPAAPAPKQGGKMGMIIGLAAGVVLLAGGAGIFMATRSSDQPGTVTPPAATQPQTVAQAPATTQPKPAELPPMPPPPAAVAQNTAGTPAGATAQPSTAPTTAPTTAPAVAAAGTPATAPATNPTPPPAEVKPAEQPKTEPTQVARVEPPVKRVSTTSSRPPPSSARNTEDDEPAPRTKPQPKSGGSADDEFDELFGTKKPSSSKPETTGPNGRTAYIPPEPGAGGASLDRLGQSDIMQVVLANKPAIVKCVSEQKKKDPGLSGKLVMRWVIQTNGKTKNVSCQTSEFRSTYMASCISGLIKGWTFPKHKVQGEPIDFPFTF